MARPDDAPSASFGGLPSRDWTIAEVQHLCRAHGIACDLTAGASFAALTHPRFSGHLTIPARRAIKPLYVRLLLDLVEAL